MGKATPVIYHSVFSDPGSQPETKSELPPACGTDQQSHLRECRVPALQSELATVIRASQGSEESVYGRLLARRSGFGC